MSRRQARIERKLAKKLKQQEKSVRLRERPSADEPRLGYQPSHAKSVRLGADPGSIFHMQMIRIPPDLFLWPPVEECVCADEFGLIGESGASSIEGFGEVVEVFEGSVCHGFVGDRPQSLGGLEFG